MLLLIFAARKQEEANLLQRRLVPFPHQPSIRKEFYHNHLIQYIDFMANL